MPAAPPALNTVPRFTWEVAGKLPSSKVVTLSTDEEFENPLDATMAAMQMIMPLWALHRFLDFNITLIPVIPGL